MLCWQWDTLLPASQLVFRSLLCMHPCLCMSVHVHVHAHTCACLSMGMHICTCLCSHVGVCMHLSIWACVHSLSTCLKSWPSLSSRNAPNFSALKFRRDAKFLEMAGTVMFQGLCMKVALSLINPMNYECGCFTFDSLNSKESRANGNYRKLMVQLLQKLLVNGFFRLVNKDVPLL